MQTARKRIIKPRKEEEGGEGWLPLETRGGFLKEINLRTSLVSIRGSVLGVFVCSG